MATDLWPHQVKAYNWSIGRKASGLFLDMGGGKSFVTIRLLEAWDAKTVVVLCPKSVMGVWPKQFDEHGKDGEWACWSNIGATVIAKKAQAAFKWYLLPTGRRKVLIINYDAAWRPGMKEFLMNIRPDVLVMDESHKIKAPGGKASMFASKLARYCSRRLLLTGTPTPYGFQDIYAQYRALDPDVFGTSFIRFKNKYAETRQINTGNKVPIEKIVGFKDDEARAEFTKKMGSVGIVITRAEMDLKIPPRNRPVERSVPLAPSVYRLYTELKNEFIAELDAGIVTANNALTKLLRLRQITSGHVRTEDGTLVVVGSEKAILLADTIEDLLPHDRPIVVFGVFHHDLNCIGSVADELGLRYGELSGRRRDGLASDSTINHGLDIVGVQLQSGGVGVDFSRACFGIYYSIDFNLGNVEQSFARLDRPGQSSSVTFIHLVATSPVGGMTVDGVTYKALQQRRQLNEAVIDALRRREL